MATPSQYHHYQLYGLNIVSDRQISDVPTAPDCATPDVTLRFAACPENLQQVSFHGKSLQLNHQEMLLNNALFGQALLHRNGNLCIDANACLTPAHTTTFVLGSVLGSMLHFIRPVPMHGMAFDSGNGAIIVLGASGSGKSTLTAAMIKAGLTVLTDDVIALRADSSGRLLAEPAHRRIKLDTGLLQQLNVDTAPLCTTAPGINKLAWTIPQYAYCATARPVSACIVLQPQRVAGAAAEITPLPALNAMMALLKNAYRPRLVKVTGNQHSFFTQCQQLCYQAAVYQVALPALGEQLSFSDYATILSKQLTQLVQPTQ